MYPYPLVPKYNGTGSTNDASNFHPVVSPHAHDYSQWIGNDLFYQPVDASQGSHGETRRSAHTHTHPDVIVVGAGHNGLVAATLLAGSGHRVLVLESAGHAGGAAVSARPFPGVDARISRYSYLVSLFPQALLRELGVAVELRRRPISSYTPHRRRGRPDLRRRERGRARRSPARWASARAAGPRTRWTASRRSRRRWPSASFPRSPSRCAPAPSCRRLVADEAAWEALFEAPLSRLLESSFDSDLVRGIVATDALIGTFAALDDPGLAQNRCFLYHVIGNGTGRWDIPVGGMGALTGRARRRGPAGRRRAAPQHAGDADRVRRRRRGGAHRRRRGARGPARAGQRRPGGAGRAARRPGGARRGARGLPAQAQPAAAPPAPAARPGRVSPQEAFAGTFHVNEGYEQLQRAYAQAAAGQIPELPPCEAYCHSLTDPTILGPELRAAGVHTLTVFGLHMPARLFRADHDAAREAAVAATLASINAVLAEPIEDCLLNAPDGAPCLEAHTPLELEAELGMPGGHIFHRDLTWPFAETEAEVGRWGVETPRTNVLLCGAGARRGGAVSGIPGPQRGPGRAHRVNL